MKAYRLSNICLALLFILSTGTSSAAPILTEKGPYLLYRQDHLVLRMEAPSLGSPRLEWRDQGKTDSLPLKRRGTFWEADLKDFKAPGTVEYRIVDKDRESEWVPLWPAAGPPKETPPLKAVKEDYKKRKTTPVFVFTVYGDNREGWGNSGAHRNLIHRMREERPYFALHTGDIVAWGDKIPLWNSYLRDGRPLFQSVPFQPTMGNHDESRQNFFAQWFPLGDPGKTYYSFEWNGHYFIGLDTTINFAPGSPQYNFLKKTLSGWKDKSPIFVYFHHPPFSGGKHGSDLNVQRFLVPLFEEYGVDIVFSGHDHDYQRIGPINGILYIVTGGGGAPLYGVERNPAIKCFRILHHYVVVQVDGKTIKGAMKNEEGEVEDRFELDHTANPVPKEKKESYPAL